MQLYFIRHGQSQNNASWDQYGSDYPRVEDPELTEIGCRQVGLLARLLAQDGSFERPPQRFDLKDVDGFHLTHLYCSLMVRAVETGAAVAEALDMSLLAWKDLHETGGIFVHDRETGERRGLPGNGRAYLEGRYPRLVLSPDVAETGWWDRPFEEREERPARARRVFERLIEQHGGTDDRVAMISHGGFYNYFMSAVLGYSYDSYRFLLNNVAITRIDFLQDRTWISYTNRTDFLSPDLIT